MGGLGREALLDLISEKWLLEMDGRLRDISREPVEPFTLLLKWFTAYHQLKRSKVRKDPEIYKTFNLAVEKNKAFVQAHLNELDDQLAHIVRRGKETGMYQRLSTGATVKLLMDSTIRFHHPALVAEQQDRDRVGELESLLEVFVRGLK